MYQNQEIQRLKATISNLKLEHIENVKKMQADLTEAQSKIFELQPYTQEISPNVAASEYTLFVASVESWVIDLLSPILDDQKHFEEICEGTKDGYHRFLSFYEEMQETDLFAMTCDNADTSIVIAVIMRFLRRKILGNPVVGMPKDETTILEDMEKGIKGLEPKRDLAHIRAWRRETYLALQNSSTGKLWKRKAKTLLALELAEILQVFIVPGPDIDRTIDSFTSQIRRSVINPAIALNDELAYTEAHFFFRDLIESETAENPATKQLWQRVDDSECLNISRAGKRFGRKEWNGGLSNVRYICTKAPALLCQGVRGNSLLDEKLLKKAQVIVAATKSDDAVPDPSRKDMSKRLIMSLYSIESTTDH